MCSEPSQIATVTNCDTTVAICDLSQFVIKAVTAHTESNNTEYVFWVFERVPRLTFDINMQSCIFVHFGVFSLVYLFMCMHISYKAYNRCTQETFLKGSDLDVNMFSELRSIPSVTIDINLRSCVLNRHKLRQSQFATNQVSLPSQFVDLSQFVIKSVPWQIQSNNIENMFCMLRRVPMLNLDRNLRGCVLTHFRIICHNYCA